MGINCSTQKYHTNGHRRITLAVDRPLGKKNARNITSIPLLGAVECINNKLPLDYLKENNENVYAICILIKLIYHLSGRAEKKMT